jgi:hypothetical protein
MHTTQAPTAPMSPLVRRVFQACGTAGLAIFAAGYVAYLDALRSAGMNGKAPPNATPIKKLIDTLTDNAMWIIITALGLVLILVAGLMMVGSKSAPDWLFKVGGGILIILVGIPALLQ